MSTKVFLIGTPEGAKANQYESMTNSLDEAQRLVMAITGGVIKEVEVKPPHKGKRS